MSNYLHTESLRKLEVMKVAQTLLPGQRMYVGKLRHNVCIIRSREFGNVWYNVTSQGYARGFDNALSAAIAALNLYCRKIR